MSNSVDPDETAQYELSHLDLCCLQSLILSPVAVKELMIIFIGRFALCNISHGLFARRGVIGRLRFEIVALPRQLLYYLPS